MEVPDGTYILGGQGVDLYRTNAGGTDYPYVIPGIVSITGSTVNPDFYYFYYDWEVTSLCRSDSTPVSVTVNPITPPTVATPSINVPGKGSGSISATASDNVVWYDVNDNQVATGGTYNLPPLTTSTTFFARNETSTSSVTGGPFDNTFGGGGFFNSPLRWLVFDVLRAGQLRSVKVFAGSAGNRTIEYRDASGAILDSVTVFVPAGESRISLGFNLQAGTSHQLAVSSAGPDLFRNNDNVSFPYSVGNYVNITQTNAGNPTGFYYYFYDWEISDPGCRSVAVPVTVNVDPFPTPTLTTPDSVCFEETATFTASSSSASWYDPNGNFLGVGQSITTPPLTTGGTYVARGESVESPQFVGPLNGTLVGGGGYHDAAFEARLNFTVTTAIRLLNVQVDAGSDGVRDIVLEDAAGNVLQTVSVFIPTGISRISLGMDIQPGSYAIGGSNMDLFRNNDGPQYPYEIPGVVSITGSNAGDNFYYYLYDWELQELPCSSNDVTFDVVVTPQITPSFSFTQNGPTFNFNNLTGQGTSYAWNFGDGNAATTQNPSHTYSAMGTYTVTLTVFDGNCSGTFNDTVVVPQGVFIDELLTNSFQLIPNPGNGSFTVKAETERLRAMRLLVYDLAGKELLPTRPQQTTFFDQQGAL